MAHYAFLNNYNVVTEVIVGRDETDVRHDWEQFYGQLRGQVCKRTSYNTFGGSHRTGGVPFRKNYACIGHSYDASRDAFIAPKPWPSWVLDEQTCLWQAPVAYPNVPGDFEWNEAMLAWQQKV